MRSSVRLGRRALGAVAIVVVSTGLAVAQANPATTAAPRESYGTAGMRVFVDPTTGAFGAPPSGNPAARAARPAAAAEPVVVVPGESAAGGVEIKLNQRFHSAMQGMVRGDGEVRVDCDAPSPR